MQKRDISFDAITEKLIEFYQEVFEKDVPEINSNLMQAELNNNIVFYLYWIDRIEHEYEIQIVEEIVKAGYQNMTIEYISKIVFDKVVCGGFQS